MWLGGWKGGMVAEKRNFNKKKNERTRKTDGRNERKTTNVKGYLILIRRGVNYTLTSKH